MAEGIWIQIISTIGVVLSGGMALLLNSKHKKTMDELEEFKKKLYKAETDIKASQLLEINKRIKIFDELKGARKINIIDQAVRQIFSHTKADRFLVLVAFNGKHKFNFITVIIQRTNGFEEITLDAVQEYVNLEADDHYNRMLQQVEMMGFTLVQTEFMEECLLRSLYELEGVKHSLIRFVGRFPLDDDNDIMAYTSTATHQEIGFTLNELATIHIKHSSHINKVIHDILKT